MKVCKFFGFFVCLLLTQACGSGKETEEKSALAAVESSIKVTAFGKTIRYKQDDLFELSCNPFFLSFLTDANNYCKAVKANVDSSSIWTLKSADGTTLFTAQENSDETLTIDGNKYICFLASGTLLDPSGNAIYSGSHLLLTSAAVTKPSDLKSEIIRFFGFINGEACLTMQ